MNRLATDQEIKALDDWIGYTSGDQLEAKDLREAMQRLGFDIVVIREPLGPVRND